MINTVHVSVAAALVTAIPNPAVSLPLALASHMVLDTVPHWNWSPGRTWRGRVASLTDGLMAVVVTWWLASASDQTLVMAIACFLSTVPDLIQAPYHFWGWRPGWLEAFIGWERKRQKWPWMSKWVGVGTQVVVFIASLWIALS